jgi:hypothetical protein
MDVTATHFKQHSAKEVGMQAPNIESMSALHDALVFELLPGSLKTLLEPSPAGGFFTLHIRRIAQ